MTKSIKDQEATPPITSYTTPGLVLDETGQDTGKIDSQSDKLPCGAGFRACARSCSPVRTSEQQPQDKVVAPPIASSSSSKLATKPMLVVRRSERESVSTGTGTETGTVASSNDTNKTESKGKRRAEIYALNQILRQVQQEKIQKFIKAQTSLSTLRPDDNNKKTSDTFCCSNNRSGKNIQPQIAMINSTVGV
jgi:hypothetical protein